MPIETESAAHAAPRDLDGRGAHGRENPLGERHAPARPPWPAAAPRTRSPPRCAQRCRSTRTCALEARGRPRAARDRRPASPWRSLNGRRRSTSTTRQVAGCRRGAGSAQSPRTGARAGSARELPARERIGQAPGAQQARAIEQPLERSPTSRSATWRAFTARRSLRAPEGRCARRGSRHRASRPPRCSGSISRCVRPSDARQQQRVVGRAVFAAPGYVQRGALRCDADEAVDEAPAPDRRSACRPVRRRERDAVRGRDRRAPARTPCRPQDRRPRARPGDAKAGSDSTCSMSRRPCQHAIHAHYRPCTPPAARPRAQPSCSRAAWRTRR